MFLKFIQDYTYYMAAVAACIGLAIVYLIGRSNGIKDLTMGIRRGCMINSLYPTNLEPGLYSTLRIMHGVTMKIRFTMVERHYVEYLKRDLSTERFYCIEQHQTDMELPSQFEVTMDSSIKKATIDDVEAIELR